jgi:hypothetical protein
MRALSPLADVTHVAYTALYENADDLVSGWSNAEQIKVNNAMLRNVIEPLVSGKSALKYVSILQGTKAYGVHLHPIAIPARETDPRDNHANFFLDQQDYIRDAGAKHGFTYAVLRPQFVTGKTPGARQTSSRPSACVLRSAACLGGASSTGVNQIFNVTNGDVFAWRSVWPALAQTPRGGCRGRQAHAPCDIYSR